VARKARAKRQQQAKIGMRSTKVPRAIRVSRATRIITRIRNVNMCVVEIVTNDACMQSRNVYSL
jgi:hypothetical protein